MVSGFDKGEGKSNIIVINYKIPIRISTPEVKDGKTVHAIYHILSSPFWCRSIHGTDTYSINLEYNTAHFFGYLVHD